MSLYELSRQQSVIKFNKTVLSQFKIGICWREDGIKIITRIFGSGGGIRAG